MADQPSRPPHVQGVLFAHRLDEQFDGPAEWPWDDLRGYLMESTYLEAPPLPDGWIYEWRGELRPDPHDEGVVELKVIGRPVRIAERTVVGD